MKRNLIAMLLVLLFSGSAWAGGGPLGIDHRVNEDNGGIWKRNNQLILLYTLVISDAGIALWEGGETRLGRTAWQAADSAVITGISTGLLKLAFGRERPSQTDDPNKFFQGASHRSFPSEEVGLVGAIVTPFVLEYRRDHPWVYALEVLPVYDMIGRVKVRGHWQSDVLAGFAIGTTFGYLAHRREMPVILNLLPHGFMVGLHKAW
jgi:membrane-associated phospholipid phosphatase